MPRLPPSLLHKAHNRHPLLPNLLRACRDLPSAQNELRWLREHAISVSRSHPRSPGWRTLLHRLCLRRGRGKPLQYILGTQPFGELEILCRKGVLIPRPETEGYVTRVAEEILKRVGNHELGRPLKILDLCTGTGCIPLLLHSLLSKELPDLQILGVDIEEQALRLAERNLRYNLRLGGLTEDAGSQVHFMKGDVLGGYSALSDTLGYSSGKPDTWDVVVSNPPYISPTAFGNGTTKRSVRNWEPKMALVPPRRARHAVDETGARAGPSLGEGDTFYPPSFEIAEMVRAKLVVLEVGDTEQAQRVARYAAAQLGRASGTEVEFWRDEGFAEGDNETQGEGRAVVCWLNGWSPNLRKD